MANIKSQIKRNRQSEKARQRNRGVKSEIKTNITNLDEAISAKDKDAAADHLKSAIQSIDRAAAKNIIHKNNAANKKSRLTKNFNSMS